MGLILLDQGTFFISVTDQISASNNFYTMQHLKNLSMQAKHTCTSSTTNALKYHEQNDTWQVGSEYEPATEQM